MENPARFVDGYDVNLAPQISQRTKFDQDIFLNFEINHFTLADCT